MDRSLLVEQSPVVRRYGSGGPLLTLLHGGPGAPGHLAPVAWALADELRVIEPFERRSGAVPLSVARHLEDLGVVLQLHAGGERSAVLGFSSGAILALALAAAHPERVSAVVLVGSATVTPATRQEFRTIFDNRLDAAARHQLQLLKELPDPDGRLRLQSQAVMPYYVVDPLSTDTEEVWYDGRGHEETWSDMLRLQESGEHPALFSRIRVPLLMMHGGADPHPGASIRTALEPHLPQLEYRELAECGHYPWLERAARDEFFTVLRSWLRARGETCG